MIARSLKSDTNVKAHQAKKQATLRINYIGGAAHE